MSDLRLIVAGAEPSRFRTLDNHERHALADRIAASGAAITMVGLGCPRQEVFAYEMRPLLSMPVLAVGVDHQGQADQYLVAGRGLCAQRLAQEMKHDKQSGEGCHRQ